MSLDPVQMAAERKQLEEEWAKLRAEKAAFEMERNNSGEEVKLFVGNLDETTVEGEVSALFGAHGEIKEVIMLKDREGKSKRSCFVKFFNKGHGEAAVEALNNKHKDKDSQRMLVVRYAQDKPKPMGGMGGFGQQQQAYGGGFGQQQQQGGYGQMGQQQMGQQQMGQQQMGGGMGMGAYGQQAAGGYGQVTNGGFGQQAAGGMGGFGQQQQAYGQQTQGGGNYGAAQPTGTTGRAPAGGFGRGPSGANLYVNNLSAATTENDLRAMFGDFGNVVSASVFAHAGYGFVSFDDISAANNAIASLNGLVIGDGSKRLEVSIKKSKGGF